VFFKDGLRGAYHVEHLRRLYFAKDVDAQHAWDVFTMYQPA
jgi:hypothetical protein